MLQIRPLSDFRDKSSEIESIESELDEADFQAASTETRLTHEEVFSKVRSSIKAD